MTSSRRRVKLSQSKRPFSSSGRRTEVLYGKWSVPNSMSNRKESKIRLLSKDKKNFSKSRVAKMAAMSKKKVETSRPSTAIGIFKITNANLTTTKTTKVNIRRQPSRPKSVAGSSRLSRSRKLVFRNQAKPCNIERNGIHTELSDDVRRLNWLRCNRIQAEKVLATYLA